MLRLPLKYSDRVFGHALIDDDCEPLSTLGYYSVTLPRRLRAYAGTRPDVILATLREDGLMRSQCRPFVSLFGTQILLVHMVVRASLAMVVLRSQSDPLRAKVTPFSTIRTEINDIRSLIGRIAYANGDRTDCRRENIREL